MFARPPVRWKKLSLVSCHFLNFIRSLSHEFSGHFFSWHLLLNSLSLCISFDISFLWRARAVFFASPQCGSGAKVLAHDFLLTLRDFQKQIETGQISWRTARWRGPVNYTGTYYTLLYINFQRWWIVYINICWYILYDMICMISYILYVFICTLLHIPYYTCVCSVSILYTIC